MTTTESTRSKARIPFTAGKDDILTQYKRTFGAFQEAYEAYLREYGVPFDHRDTIIPDVFKYYYQLAGLRQAIRDMEPVSAIHEEIAEQNDYGMWDC